MGRYFLYQTIANIPAIIISFSIGATLWPKCIKLAATGDQEGFSILWEKLNSLYLLIIFSLSVLIAVFVPITFKVLERFPDDFALLYTLIASSAAFVLCDPYKLSLYTDRKDRALLVGNMIQLLLVTSFVGGGLLLNNIESIAMGLFAANSLSLLSYRFEVPSRIAVLIVSK